MDTPHRRTSTKRALCRHKEEAVLWYEDATITLVGLNAPLDFDDFIELEEFLVKYPREHDIDDAAGELQVLTGNPSRLLFGTAIVKISYTYKPPTFGSLRRSGSHSKGCLRRQRTTL